MIWLDEPHHDGSALYLEPGPYELGDRVPARVRVPDASRADQVVLRAVVDGEPQLVEARRDRTTGTDEWWAVDVPLDNPVVSYRFGLERGGRTRWLHAGGTSPIDASDASDFRVSTHASPPAWLADAIGYQIVPDRFARGGERPPTPEWATPAEWGDPVEHDGVRAVRQWYGGDLAGVEAHLDHLVELGVDLVYLTPFFPARSSHRYDATTFDHVDPLLGGDAALASLTAAAHRRGIRIIGDLTLNHTGSHHEWFLRACSDPGAPEARFYLFRDHPDDYAAWYDVPTLPKLDHRSAELRCRLIEGTGSVTARWLAPPFELDGWRIDCANTAARHGDTDVNREVAAAMRATIAASGDGRWLVAEHCYDARTELEGSGWHGVMAYQWFTRPITQWLATVRPIRMMSARPLGELDGVGAATSMRTLAAGVPWAAFTASMTMLDSHDTARFRTLVGDDRQLHRAAMTLLMAYPGVPTIFAGSEVGVTGTSMDTGRAPLPWDRGVWDLGFHRSVCELIALRRSSPALRHGGLRWVHADADSVTFLRETADERVLVHASRSDRLCTFPASSLDARSVSLLSGDLDAAFRPDRLEISGGPGAAVWHLERPFA